MNDLIETFSFGVSGLDVRLMHWIEFDNGVIFAPTDPWFTFFIPSLSPLATEWVRQNNLDPKQLRWLYWLPFDPGARIYEWFPEWNAESKRYKPLDRRSSPIHLGARHTPPWALGAVTQFQKTLADLVPPDDPLMQIYSRDPLGQ